jgi:hypothetical protein
MRDIGLATGLNGSPCTATPPAGGFPAASSPVSANSRSSPKRISFGWDSA